MQVTMAMFVSSVLRGPAPKRKSVTTSSLAPRPPQHKKAEAPLARREMLGASLATGLAASLLSGKVEAAAAVTIKEADNRMQVLEAQMGQLLQQEKALEFQIQDALGSRAVAKAEQAGNMPLVPEVLELYPDTWEESIGQSRATFVEFYAPWCPYCKRLDPIWKQLATDTSAKGSNVQIARINADTYTEFMGLYNISGFPTLVMFESGRPTRRYNGRPELDALTKFVS